MSVTESGEVLPTSTLVIDTSLCSRISFLKELQDKGMELTPEILHA
jgi:hypothetical protein